MAINIGLLVAIISPGPAMVHPQHARGRTAEADVGREAFWAGCTAHTDHIWDGPDSILDHTAGPNKPIMRPQWNNKTLIWNMTGDSYILNKKGEMKHRSMTSEKNKFEPLKTDWS